MPVIDVYFQKTILTEYLFSVSSPEVNRLADL